MSHLNAVSSPTQSADFTSSAAMWVARSQEIDIPAPVMRLAGQCLLDWFAVTIAGTAEELSPIITAVTTEGKIDPQGVALVGQQGRASEQQAARINGTISHALDFDDVNLRMHGHPTVTLAPALLAVAEQENLSGVALLRAFAVGYQVAGRLGHAMGDTHYARGFHATGTIGAVAAAAGCASLLKLDENQTEAALGLAATQASGLKAMFGTMAKPMHAGNAAANGIIAARLAQRGFTARAGGLEHPQGFGAAMSDDSQFSGGDFQSTPPGAPEWEITRNLFKYHAACYLTHSTIEALARLRKEHGAIDPAEIAAITLHVPEGHRTVCDVLEPRTGLDIKFSIRHLAALALAGADTADLSLYSQATALKPELAALRKKVQLSHQSDRADRYGAEVVVNLVDGTELNTFWDVSTPVENLDAQEDALKVKAATLIDPILGNDASKALFAAVAELPTAADLTGLLASTLPSSKDITKTG